MVLWTFRFLLIFSVGSLWVEDINHCIIFFSKPNTLSCSVLGSTFFYLICLRIHNQSEAWFHFFLGCDDFPVPIDLKQTPLAWFNNINNLDEHRKSSCCITFFLSSIHSNQDRFGILESLRISNVNNLKIDYFMLWWILLFQNYLVSMQTQIQNKWHSICRQ